VIVIGPMLLTHQSAACSGNAEHPCDIIIIIITNEKIISDAVAKTLQGHFTRLQ